MKTLLKFMFVTPNSSRHFSKPKGEVMKTAKTSKRRQFSMEQKCMILTDYFEKKASMIEISKKHGIHPVTLAQWKRQMSDKDPKMNHSQADLIAQVEKQKSEIKRLKKIVGDLSLDKDILEEAIELFKKSPKKPKSK
jgi:transposase-like protein